MFPPQVYIEGGILNQKKEVGHMTRRRNQDPRGNFKLGEFHNYYATTKVNLGFLSDRDQAVDLYPGEVLSTDGSVVRLRDMERHAPQIRGAILAGFLSTDPDEEYQPRPAITKISAAVPNSDDKHYKVDLDYSTIENVDDRQRVSRRDYGNVTVNEIQSTNESSTSHKEFEEFLAWKAQKAKASKQEEIDSRRNERAESLRKNQNKKPAPKSPK